MKITIIHPHTINYPGGAEKWIIDVSTRLVKRGHRVSVVYTSASLNPLMKTCNSRILKRHGVELVKCSSIKLPIGFPLINPWCVLEHVVDSELVYLMSYPPNEILYSLFRKRIRKPIVVGFHSIPDLYSLPYRLYMGFSIRFYKKFDYLHVTTWSFYKILTITYNVPPDKVCVIPNGIETRKYYIEDSGEPFRVLWTGRLCFDKGADILCRIIERFNEEYRGIASKIEFVVTGSGPYSKYIEAIARKYGNVKYLGYLDASDLRKVYASSHLYLAPSRSEGLSLRVLEALASGLPVIASRVTGLVDLVKNRFNGNLVDLLDINSYVKYIMDYYSIWSRDREYYTLIRNRIREYIVSRYDIEHIVDMLELFFKNIV